MDDKSLGKFCALHSKEEVQLFCKDCEVTICRECIVSLHTRHEFIRLEDAIDNAVKQLQGTIADVENHFLPNLENKLGEVRDRKALYSTGIEQLVNDVQSNGSKLKVQIDKFCSEIEKELLEIKQNDETTYDTVISKLESFISRVRDIVQSSKASIKDGGIDVLYKYMDAKFIYKGEVEVPTISLPSVQCKTAERAKLEKYIGILSKPTIDEGCRYPLLEQVKVSGCCYASTGIRCISEFCNNTAWITNPSKPHVLDQITLKETSFQRNKRIELDKNNEILGLAMSGDGHLYVTTKKSTIIQIIKHGSSRSKRFVDLLRYQPYGICVSNNNDVIATVIENEEHTKENFFMRRAKVLRFSVSGQLLQTIENYGHERLFHFPQYVRENKNGDICVSDMINYDEGRVVVVDSSGKVRFICESRNDQSPLHPMGVACDDDCRILIADKKEDLVFIIDKDGTFLKQILTKKECLSEPSGLSICLTGEVVVVCPNSKVYAVKYCESKDKGETTQIV